MGTQSGRSERWADALDTSTGLPAPNSTPMNRERAGSGRSRNSVQQTPGLSIQVDDGCPIAAGLQFFADVPWGRILQICSFRGYVVGKVNEPGANAEPSRSRPRRSKTPQCWPPARVPNQIRGVLVTWETFTWLPCPTQTGDALAPMSLVCDS